MNGLQEEEKKHDVTALTFGNSKMDTTKLSPHVMDTQAFGQRLGSAESMISEKAQNELNKIPDSLKNIFKRYPNR